jgi:mono/diheme cytochrome c family protein
MRGQMAILRAMSVFFFLLCLSPAFAQTLPEDPGRGEQVYVSKGCAKCHGPGGEDGNRAPDLSKEDLGDTQLDLAVRIWNHTPSMLIGMEKAGITKPTLTGQEFGEISAYLSFLRFLDEKGNAPQGSAVFTEKGCRLCHPLSGKKPEGSIGLEEFPKNISPVFLAKAIWNHSLEMIARMVEIGMKWPRFMGTEMVDLSAYIQANAKGAEDVALFTKGNPKEGEKVFAAKGCYECHSIRGRGGKGGSDLGEVAKGFYTTLTQIASTMWNKGPTVLVKMVQTRSGGTKFTSKEMVDLLAYLYFLHSIDEPGDIGKGRELFSEKGCSQCHGLDGRRGRLMYIDLSRERNMTQTEIVASLWNHTVEIQKAIGEQGLTWPRLEKGEMADLLEYVRMPTRVKE